MSKGSEMYNLAKRLFPICRSITGNGFRQSLEIIREYVPGFKVLEVATGTKVFDWEVPKEWNISAGWIKDSKGNTILDFRDNNLHVVGYSVPVSKRISRDELLEHIYTQPDQPSWIPYVTSYYSERWGFCMSENQKNKLDDEQYEVYIDSRLEKGSLTYGEYVLPGESSDEILFSTYLCHPSMANNELSGPCLMVEIIKYIQSLPTRRYTYRFVIVPETIGSITYISRNLDSLKQRVKAGFVLSCVGDNRSYSYIATRKGDSLADRVLKNVLKYSVVDYVEYSFLKRGSDERQYGSVGVDLPVCGFCRTKYGMYPEYHTSADNLDLISEEGLQGSYDIMHSVINVLENNYYYRILCLCEPQLGKRGLYPTLSKKGSYDSVRALKNFIAYADGDIDLIDISNTIGVSVDVLLPIIDSLKKNDLLDVLEKKKSE